MMNYWTKRQHQLKAAVERDETRLKKRLSDYYDLEFRKLEKAIAHYYQAYGEDNVIAYRKMTEALTPADYRFLMEQMDDFAAKYPQYADMLPVRASIYQLNRLEGLQQSVMLSQKRIGAVNSEQIGEHLKKQALRSANAAAETLGFGKSFYSENDQIIQEFVNRAWSGGKNFSARIWENTDKLAAYLNTDIAQGFARGTPYEKLVANIRRRFDQVSRRDAYRLIYTEGTYVMAEAGIAPFTKDFKQYRLAPVVDGKVCAICAEVKTHVFNIEDRTPGENFPPLHPWCRCSFELVVEDWDAWQEDYVRNNRVPKDAERIIKRIANGGEGAIIKAKELLPRYKEAVIPESKLLNYALNPEKDFNKAEAFKKALGYTLDNADELIAQVREKLPDYKAVEKGDRGWGMTYEVIMNIKGPNGKTAKVLTAWIDDNKNGEMRLTTIHVDD